ncbi:HRDC domain-containing protein [Nocardioides taihuensis]|uniref:HRDC domain-containing protein n=1 Tax=Nocardioides taihuensis TaxID=1835606 RepID=A0ABW0BKV4_9ACTN
MTTSDEPTTPDPAEPADAAEAEVEVETPPKPLLELRDGLPDVVETAAGLAEVCAAVAAGTGPVAIDAERASGYRYSSRAYLIQLRREGSGTHLVDPIAFDSMAPLQEAIGDAEWILHAATQDLPCLAEVGLTPARLFDTELAGRLLGYPRVGLATLVETLLGARLAKEHSAVDWSTRPLPKPWLEYAALDVEVLVELRACLAAELEAAGKAEWAAQEFDAMRSFRPSPRVDAWRRTSGLHKVRGRRALGAVRELWETRDEIAERRDVTPGRILPDSAIITAATVLSGDRANDRPLDKATLLGTRGFHGRGAERYASRWVAALTRVAEMPERDLPTRSPRTDGPPVARAWAEKDPVAARRLTLARAAVSALSERVGVPAENLLTPDSLRRVLWAPPRTREPEALGAGVAELLTGLGARPWQVELVGPLLVAAVLEADALTVADARTEAVADVEDLAEDPDDDAPEAP